MGSKKRTLVKSSTPRKTLTRPSTKKKSPEPVASTGPVPQPQHEEIQTKVLDGLLSVVRRLRKSLGS